MIKNRKIALSKLLLVLSFFFLFSYLSTYYTFSLGDVNVPDFHHTETENQTESESQSESYGNRNFEIEDFYYLFFLPNHDSKLSKKIKYSFLYKNLNIDQGYIPPKVKPPMFS